MKMGVKTKERIARIIGEHFTTSEIVNVFTDANITTDEALYAKWRIILDAFSRIKTEEGFFHIIKEFCHPLNFPDLTIRTAFIEKLNAVLTYEDLEIRATDRTVEIRTSAQIALDEKMYKEKLDHDLEVPQELIDEMRVNFENDLLINIKEVEVLLNTHQSYMDVIEIFCQDTKKPTIELNEAYLFLAQKIQQIIKGFQLQGHPISIYRPFKDLYCAEIEWNGSGKEFEIRSGPKLSWDGVRPSLHNVHSKITQLLIDIRNSDKEDEEMTGDEKRLEQINALISNVRTQQNPKTEVVEEKTMKVEITKMPDLNVRTSEEETIQKGRKKIALPKFNHTEWNKAEIRFIDEQNVYITADTKNATADYETLGFRDDKSDKPNKAWKFFFALAQNNGETKTIPSPIPDTIKQKKRQLSDRLKTLFKNDTDPFYDFTETNTYKIKVKLIPPAEIREDKFGVGEYLNETMISK